MINSSRTRDKEEDVSEILGQGGREDRSQEDRGTEEVRYGTPRWIPLGMVVITLLLVVAIGYGMRRGQNYAQAVDHALTASNGRANQLDAKLDVANSKITQLQGELNAATRRIGMTQTELARARAEAQRTEEARRTNDEALGAQIGQVAQAANAKIGEVATGLGVAKTDIAATAKDLADTKARLTSTMGDLGVQSGLIARTRGDLEALRQLGDRTIYDFNLVKSKTPQRVGPVQIRLTRADAKRFRYTILLVADDKSIEKKDRTVGEPLQFRVRDARAPYEIVVMEVSKDRVIGYLSTPK